jgi:hypothetical protein
LKKGYVFWLVSFILSFIGFYLIENIFTIKPNVISGNGNVGILIILLFTPIFIASYYFTFRMVGKKLITANKSNVRMVTMVLLLSSCILLIFPIINYFNELVIALGGNPNNPNSRIYRFGWFNQYTNSIYFNFYTFLITHILAAFISVLFSTKYVFSKKYY